MKTKEKILLIAYKTFIKNGYHNTSMQQLVEESNLSKGAFYHHFKNKKDLYVQVIEKYFLSFYRMVDWNINSERKVTINDIENEIKNFYLSFLPQVLAITDEGLSRYCIMYFEAFNLIPEFKEEIQFFYNKLENIIINAADNTEKSRDIAISIISKYEGLIFLMAINPKLTLNEIFNLPKLGVE